MKLNLPYRLFIGLCSYGIRLLLSVRYRVRVKGFEDLLALKEEGKGILFLPNHPAEIDPVILMSLLGPHFYPRAVVVEHFYHLKGFQFIMDLARVIPIPSTDKVANQWRAKEVAKIFKKIKEAGESGEHFLIYPSGKLKRDALEKLGGASFIHDLLREKPTTAVVLIRTTGLWGSSFSCAMTGKPPSFGATLRQGAKTVCKNLLFFVPKRDVLVEFEVMTEKLPIQESRLELNRFLEDWYNQYPYPGEEPLSLVRYLAWNKKLPKIEKKEHGKKGTQTVSLSLKVQEEIYNYLAKLSKIPKEKITPDTDLSFDLGLDSLDVANIHLFLDQKYDLKEVEIGSLIKVNDLFKAISQNSNDSDFSEIKRKPIAFWERKEKRPDPQCIEGDLIPELFLKSCDRMGKSIACADQLSGTLSYKKLKIATLLLSLKIRKFPGKKIGVLLPSSVGAYATILAIFLAGKIPVMLNWTSGKLALAHAFKLGDFQVTLTSKKFLDRISLEDLSPIEDTFHFLEEIKASITWKEKVKSVFLHFFSANSLMEKLPIEKDPEKTAVLLFTSGTESLPKAVPLSHYHILTNQKSALSCVNLTKKDVMYGVLPPFHSFGFSLTGLLPLLAGIKTFYAPDPTDSRMVAADIESAKVTLFCCAPSFIRSLFAVASRDQLQSLRFLVAGAEKATPDIPEYIRKYLPNCIFIEGYGITECSPVITLQRPNEEKRGVGRAIPGVELLIVDANLLPLQPGNSGEVCIRGPSVFEGYLEGGNPFFFVDQKKWYRSGDLGYLDADQNLYLTDRLKRTIKIGGEMVSLGGIEEELLRVAKERMWYTSSQEGPPLAVIARDGESQKAEIVLFTTFDIEREEAIQALRESGFGRIVKISEIIKISEIPLTGTGKTHHRALQERLK